MRLLAIGIFACLAACDGDVSTDAGELDAGQPNGSDAGSLADGGEGDAGAIVQSQSCADYMACCAAYGADCGEETFGPNGSCWTEMYAEGCDAACADTLRGLPENIRAEHEACRSE